MKKLLFVSFGLIFCVVESVAMHDKQLTQQKRFSAADNGVDMGDRGGVADFYRDKLAEFEKQYETIKNNGIWKDTEQHIQEINAFIAQVAHVSEGSEWDLNTDALAGQFGQLIDRADDDRTELQRAQRELIDRSRKIDNYWRRVRSLKDRFFEVRFGRMLSAREQKIVLLQGIISEALSIKEKSQRELHEVGFAHEVGPLIRDAQGMLTTYQQRDFLQSPMFKKDTFDKKKGHLKRSYTK